MSEKGETMTTTGESPLKRGREESIELPNKRSRRDRSNSVETDNEAANSEVIESIEETTSVLQFGLHMIAIFEIKSAGSRTLPQILAADVLATFQLGDRTILISKMDPVEADDQIYHAGSREVTGASREATEASRDTESLADTESTGEEFGNTKITDIMDAFNIGKNLPSSLGQMEHLHQLIPRLGANDLRTIMRWCCNTLEPAELDIAVTNFPKLASAAERVTLASYGSDGSKNEEENTPSVPSNHGSQRPTSITSDQVVNGSDEDNPGPGEDKFGFDDDNHQANEVLSEMDGEMDDEGYYNSR